KLHGCKRRHSLRLDTSDTIGIIRGFQIRAPACFYPKMVWRVDKGGLAPYTYNYTIRTGSYPQIHHTSALPTANGWINCSEFVDANGKKYEEWIPAIRLE
ncbi:MAG: hypothetical protein ACXQTW_07675, partial [Candidatus Methanospirareceae archaeon]